MSAGAFGTFTEEERAANLASAMKATADLKATAHELKQDWYDDGLWGDLAGEFGFRLPAMYVRPTAPLMRRYLRKLKISGKEFLEWSGCESIEAFQGKNPRWPLRALVGVLAEYAAERNAAREGLKGKLGQPVDKSP